MTTEQIPAELVELFNSAARQITSAYGGLVQHSEVPIQRSGTDDVWIGAAWFFNGNGHQIRLEYESDTGTRFVSMTSNIDQKKSVHLEIDDWSEAAPILQKWLPRMFPSAGLAWTIGR